MKPLQNEVREVARGKDEIDEQNLEKIPYLKAVLKESLKLHIPIPLLIPHESTQYTNVFGYDITSRTRVMINAWAISHCGKIRRNFVRIGFLRLAKTLEVCILS